MSKLAHISVSTFDLGATQPQLSPSESSSHHSLIVSGPEGTVHSECRTASIAGAHFGPRDAEHCSANLFKKTSLPALRGRRHRHSSSASSLPAALPGVPSFGASAESQSKSGALIVGTLYEDISPSERRLQLLEEALKERTLALRLGREQEVESALTRQVHIEMARLWSEMSEKMRDMERELSAVKSRQRDSDERLGMAARRAVDIARSSRNTSLECEARIKKEDRLAQDVLLLQERLSNYIEEQDTEQRNNRKSSSHKKTSINKKRSRRKFNKGNVSVKKMARAESDGGEPEPWDATVAGGVRVDVDVDVTSFVERNVGITLGEYVELENTHQDELV